MADAVVRRARIHHDRLGGEHDRLAPLKPLVARPAEWIDRAPVRIQVTRELGAPPTQVFAVLADHEHWPRWFRAVKQVEVIGAAEGVGAERRVSIPGVVVEEEFVEWEPPRRFAFTLTRASRAVIRSMNERVVLEPIDDDRTRLTYTQGIDPRRGTGGFVRLLGPLLRRGLADGMKGLAKRVERGGS